MIVTILIILGAVVALVTAGLIVGYYINHDRGQRASGEHNFRPEGATRVTLPLRVEPHRDVLAAAWDRPWLHNDLPQAAPYRPDRLALMAAEYEPPNEEVMPHARTRRDVAAGAHMNLPGPYAPGAEARTAFPAARAGELHPAVIAALTAAGAEDTVIRMTDLEPIVGGDPLDGHGTVDAYVDWLFAGIKVGVA